MTAARIQKLKDRLFDANGVDLTTSINRAFDHIGFTEAYVDQLIATDKDRPLHPKVVKDNIWGMVELDGRSLRLIDSPILQRLRHVRQLGLSYLTYPTAEHSRFAHSLGMSCVVGHFLDASQKISTRYHGHQAVRLHEKPSDRTTTDDNILRHAALLHDTGHFPFSHALENIVEGNSKLFMSGNVTVDRFIKIL